VIPAKEAVPMPDVVVLIATVVNSSTYTISNVQGQFSPDGRSLIGPAVTDVPSSLGQSFSGGWPLGVAGHGANVAPGGSIKFSSGRIWVGQGQRPVRHRALD
jgi:hypothetical protein